MDNPAVLVSPPVEDAEKDAEGSAPIDLQGGSQRPDPRVAAPCSSRTPALPPKRSLHLCREVIHYKRRSQKRPKTGDKKGGDCDGNSSNSLAVIERPVRPRKRSRDEDGVGNPRYNFNSLMNWRSGVFKSVVETLTPLQKEDVKAIGFGGLLSYSCDVLPDQMDDWLIQCFDPITKYFSCHGQIRFSVTARDAKRVFGLPLNSERPVVSHPHNPEVRGIIKRWRKVHRLQFLDELSLDMVREMIERLKEGGDDFKRFFVLYAMSMLLTPAFATTVDLGLLNALWDVSRIREHNWAGFVVEDLCHKMYMYGLRVQKKASDRGCQGCLLLLQLTYFHNTIWPDSPLSSDEPYIRHWGGTNIGYRVMEEMRAKGLGNLLFLDDIHGVNRGSRHAVQVPVIKQGITQGNGHWMSLDTEEIGNSIQQETKRKAWHVMSDVNAVVSGYADSLELRTRRLKDCCVKQSREGPVQFDVRYGYDVIASNLYKVCSSLSPSLGIVERGLYPEANPINEPMNPNFEEDVLIRKPWKAWTFHYPPTFTADLLQQVCQISHNFKQYKLEVADFCLSGGLAAQILFENVGGLTLTRADMWTLEPFMNVSSPTINVFATLLNKFWNRNRWTSRVCLQSVKIGKKRFDPKAVVNDWLEWLGDCELDICDANLVYIPVIYRQDWFLVVINAMDRKVQFIEPKRPLDGNTGCEERARKIGTCFWMLLEVEKFNGMLEGYRGFSYEMIKPRWSEGMLYTDEGICVMNMMERFTGSHLAIEDMMLDEAKKRLQLRVSYLCFIALDDSNLRRRTILDDCAGILAAKGVAAAS